MRGKLSLKESFSPRPFQRTHNVGIVFWHYLGCSVDHWSSAHIRPCHPERSVAESNAERDTKWRNLGRMFIYLQPSITDHYASVVVSIDYISLLQWEKGDHAVVDEVVKYA